MNKITKYKIFQIQVWKSKKYIFLKKHLSGEHDYSSQYAAWEPKKLKLLAYRNTHDVSLSPSEVPVWASQRRKSECDLGNMWPPLPSIFPLIGEVRFD